MLGRPSHRLPTPVALIVLLAPVLLGAWACRGEAKRPRGEIFPLGRLITQEGLRCAPDRQWVRRHGTWTLQGVAEIGCWVADPAPETVRFDFTPQTGKPFCLRLLWDEEMVLPPTLITGERSVEIPAELRKPGAHNLVLERCPMEGDTAGPRVSFRRLAMDDGSGAPKALGSRSTERDGFVADFLIYGLTGIGRRVDDGVLADGPASFDVDVAGHGGETLRLETANVSGAPARFVAEAGSARSEVSVPPGEWNLLHLELPGDARSLELSVEGAEDGAYLFGAPRLVPAPRTAETRRAAETATAPPRLILFITLDTTRRDALGAYGAPPEVTPNLDAVARQATVFDHAVSTAPWTLPSHASMFTGLYPSQHRAGVQSRWLVRGSEALATRLRRAGYLTAGFAGGHLMDHDFGVGQGFAVYYDPENFRTEGKRLTQQALQLVDQADGEDLFLFVNYFDTHMPYTFHPAFSRKLGVPAARRALPPGLWQDAASGDDPPAFNELAEGRDEMTAAGLAWLRAAYLAEMAYVDHQFGGLVDGLKARGLWDDALVVVVADHGEMLGEDGLLSHAYRLTPELIDVPLLIKWPGQTEGKRDPRLVSGVDLFPTVLAAAGLDPPPTEGFDLAGRPRRSLALFEEHGGRVHGLVNRHLYLADHLWGMRQARLRRVFWQGGEKCAQLADGGAWNPVACPPGGDRILAAIQKRLGAPEEGAAAATGSLSEKDREALKALGYL